MSQARPLTNIGKFHQGVDQLFEICLTHAHKDKIKGLHFYQYQLELGRKANSKLMVEIIMEALAVYLDKIMVRDSDFFINLDLSKTYAEARGLGILHGLKDLWLSLNCDKTKEKIWKLVQLVIMYGALVTKNPAYLAVINKYRVTPLIVE